MTDTRERIVETAFELFLTRGYERTSMAELVAATGLSKGALYHHFSGKEALRDAVSEHFWLRYMTPVDGGDHEQDLDLADELHRLARGYAELLASVTRIAGDPVAYHRFVLDAFPGTRTPLVAALERTHEAVAGAARRAQSAGAISTALSPERIAETAIAVIEGSGLLCGLDPRRDPRTTLAAAVQDLLTMLAENMTDRPAP